MTTTQAYWVTARGRGALREESRPVLADGQSLVRARFSGVSPGTERLVGRGEVPEECREPMACRYMAGGFDLPVKYGYSLVGQAVEGQLAGRDVFVMHPHQELAAIEDEHAVVLPEDLPAHRATLIPNTETALNAVWDADLRPGARAVVVGGGPVGLLIAWVLKRLGFGPAPVVDTDPKRREHIASWPFVAAAADAGELEADAYDVAFHTTGHGAGLQTAVSLVGFEGAVIELSWYGTRPVTLALGSDFHYLRKRIFASQVAHVAAPRRGEFNHEQRMAEVLRLLADDECECLFGDAVEFAAMPELMAQLYQANLDSPCPLIRYASTS